MQSILRCIYMSNQLQRIDRPFQVDEPGILHIKLSSDQQERKRRASLETHCDIMSVKKIQGVKQIVELSPSFTTSPVIQKEDLCVFLPGYFLKHSSNLLFQFQ